MGTSEAEADGMIADEDKRVTFLQTVWASVSQLGPSERHSALMTQFWAYAWALGPRRICSRKMTFDPSVVMNERRDLIAHSRLCEVNKRS